MLTPLGNSTIAPLESPCTVLCRWSEEYPVKYTRGVEIVREVIVLRKTEKKKRKKGKNSRKIKAGCSRFMTGWPTIHGIIMNKNRGEIIIAHKEELSNPSDSTEPSIQ